MPTITLTAESAGYDDGNTASITVNQQEIGQGWVGRGINVAVLDDAGYAIATDSFDTYLDDAESDRLVAFLDAQAAGRLVVAVVLDEASRALKEEAKAAFEALGSTRIRDLADRDGWALITRKGTDPSSAETSEALSPAGAGAARVERTVDTIWQQLAERFAPQVFLDSDDKYRPSSVEWYFARCWLHDRHGVPVLESDGRQQLADGWVGRGINVAVLDEAGEPIATESFDTYLDAGESVRLAAFLEKQAAGSLIVALVLDDGSRALGEEAKAAFEGLGSTRIREFGYRDSWALITRQGAEPGSSEISEELSRAGKGAAWAWRQLGPERQRALTARSAGYDDGNTATITVGEVVGGPRLATALPHYDDEDEHKKYYLAPAGEGWRRGELASAQFYAHFLRSRLPDRYPEQADLVDIQYWFWYPYNGTTWGGHKLGMGGADAIGSHNTDWEHVTVRVRVPDWTELGTSSVEAVYFAAHSGEGKWRSEESEVPGEYQKKRYALHDRTRAKVCAAWETHASYERPGRKKRGGSGGDIVIGLGKVASGEFEEGGNQIWEGVQGLSGALDDRANGKTEWRAPAGKPLAVAVEVEAGLQEAAGRPFSNVGWLDFQGYWGDFRDRQRGHVAGQSFNLDEKAKRGPKTKGNWEDGDDHNGYYQEFTELATLGEDWGDGRSGTAVAFGILKVGEVEGVPVYQRVMGVGRGSGKNQRFVIYTGTDLAELASGGRDWNDNWATRGIAFGVLDGDTVVAVCTNAHRKKHPRLHVYRYDPASRELERLWTAGEGWGDDRTAKAVAFGFLGGKQVVGVTRNNGSGPRLLVYEYDEDEKKLVELARAGEEWGKGRHGPCVAFGELNGTSLVAVGRNKGKGPRVVVYQYDGSATLAEVCTAGEEWRDDRYASGVAFSGWDVAAGDEKNVLAVSRNPGDGARFFVFDYSADPEKLDQRFAGGTDWSGQEGATGIDVGRINGDPVLAVATTGAELVDLDPAEIYLYKEADGEFVLYSDGTGRLWGQRRDATAIAIGRLGAPGETFLGDDQSAAGTDVVGYTRDKGGNQRGGILKWQ